MGWDEWALSLIQPGTLHSEGRSLMRKATSRVAIGSYRPLIEANNRQFLKNALGMVGDPLPLVNQYISPFDLRFLLTGFYRGVGELIVRITYADALSKEEVNDLIKKNEEAVRLGAEAFTKVYLVNFIPIRTLISMQINPFTHLLSTSQVYSCLGTRRWVPAVSRACQDFEQRNSQWTLGEGAQRYCELVSSKLSYSYAFIGLW